MKILSIETSCDETAVSVVEGTGGLESPSFTVLGNALFSQIDIHKEYGGVFPMVAKREHAKKLVPLLLKVLKESALISNSQSLISKENTNTKLEEIREILKKEEGLFEQFATLAETGKPDIDVVSVTAGPGLVPALWVGVSFATALSKLWDIPVIGANHMEGHIASVLLNKTEAFSVSNSEFSNKVQFPALALLISGGHTELVEIEGWGKYKIIGETRDDAVGEAFDKVARMLDLPYPGGPEISRLAEQARTENMPHVAKLPRPMIHSNTLEFSFAGLKTAVLYYLRDTFDSKNTIPTEPEKADIAREFEDAVVEILVKKTSEALEQTGAKTLIIAGGVIANKKLRETFMQFESTNPELTVKIPPKGMSGDNALMIAYATYIHVTLHPELLVEQEKIIANGNLRLE